MSLQFKSAAVAVLVSLGLGCASVSPQNVDASAAAVSTAPLADVVADTRTLEQPSNAARLDAVQTLLQKRGNSMVNVDIAGYGDTIMSGPTAGTGTAPLHQALARVCAARDYTCLRFAAFPAGDDRSFQAAGIPAISMAVLPALEAHQVWLLLNGGKESGLAAGFAPTILRTIHTSADDGDKLSAVGMTLIYNAVLGLLLELDAR